MNERIQELLDKAHKHTNGGIYNGHLSEWTEKFAELIVRECMKVATPNYIGAPEDSVYYVEQAVDRIAEHFGFAQ